ncbi:hypothetical protein [Virgisporangium ochraceum]|uniref:Uncharacterized protein n=1 Tax=Virgisporangium ochraceum TaxID=65505 RepID=A0A8J3ZPZ8_9ACTN|nr:hypothetical protein [Virgisporangium ochraceum]GIJ68057.1 hypothetical protein Voc01_029740 [Virgisporangium ochraceum]
MTTDLEEHLAAGMRQETRGIALTDDVLGRARRGYRQRAAVTRLGYGLGVVAVAGALAAGLFVTAPEQTSDETVAQQSPALRLANAATASNSTSYRIRFETKARASSDGVQQPEGPPVVWEGAFDPNTATGYAKSSFEWGVTTELLIKGTRYVGTEPRADGKLPPGEHEQYSLYGQYPGTHDRLTYGAAEMPVLNAAAPDPAGLLKALREADATVTEKPDGTLTFSYATTADHGSQTFKGDVTLDGTGRIASMVVVATWETTIKKRLDKGEVMMTTTFSDWGLPVTVERPAKVQPVT